MTKKKLDGAHVSPAFEKVNGKGMSKRVRRNRFRDAAEVMCFLTGLLDGVPGDVLAGDITWKQPLYGPLRSPPVAQGFQQFRRKHNVAIFLPFALFDPDHHALAVNVTRLQADGFRDPKTRRIARSQNRAVLDVFDAVQKLQHFFWAQNDRQCLGLFGCWNDVFDIPASMERDFVEEAQSCHGDEYGTRRQSLFVRQVHLISTNVFGTEYLRRFTEVSRESRNLFQVALLGVR